MKIVSAANSALNLSPLPQMDGALEGWFQQVTIALITKTIDNFLLVETSTVKNILAVKQPFTSKDLEMKPEGQRAWSWYTLHVKAPDEFSVDDVFTLNSIPYRVAKKWDWKDAGYFEYHIYEDYTA